MKAFVAMSLLVLSSAVLAMPKVGDMAEYAGTVSGMSLVQHTELTAFDAAKNTFSQTDTTTAFGQQSVEVIEATMDDLLTEAQIAMILSLCESNQVHGKLETVTVAAGTFQTCGVTDAQSNKTNIGMVPFGLVKSVGPALSLELTKYKIAQ